MKLMANCNDQLLSSCANIGFDPKMKIQPTTRTPKIIAATILIVRFLTFVSKLKIFMP